jgi:hypothetical protein
VAGGQDIGRSSSLDLVEFSLAVAAPLLVHPGLEKAATATAAIVGAAIGLHIDKIVGADQTADDEAHVLSDRFTVCLAHDHAGVLNGELDEAGGGGARFHISHRMLRLSYDSAEKRGEKSTPGSCPVVSCWPEKFK